MTRPSLLVAAGDDTPRWRDALAARLQDFEVGCWPDTPREVDFALVWRPPPQLFAQTRVRRAVFNLGAGVDALLAMPALPRDVPIVRLEDAGMAVQMAEYVTLAVLRAYREVEAYREQQYARLWRQRERLPKSDFAIGILGLGVLGRAVANALRAFEFPILGWSATRKTLDGVASHAGADGLADVLARSRVLVVLLPATDATRGLVDRHALAKLPHGAHLVNVARGSLVVEDDLVEALDSGRLASATLDVFKDEPLPAAHRFWHHPKIVLTPHVSAATLFDESAQQVAAKLRAMLRGESVDGVVDRGRGY